MISVGRAAESARVDTSSGMSSQTMKAGGHCSKMRFHSLEGFQFRAFDVDLHSIDPRHAVAVGVVVPARRPAP
jgi:hypothetical protein